MSTKYYSRGYVRITAVRFENCHKEVDLRLWQCVEDERGEERLLQCQ